MGSLEVLAGTSQRELGKWLGFYREHCQEERLGQDNTEEVYSREAPEDAEQTLCLRKYLGDRDPPEN